MSRGDPPDPEQLAREVMAGARIMVVGAPATGKTTLITAVADEALAAGASLPVITADPGQPAFGPPGAVSLAYRGESRWLLKAVEGLATLDVARFRLPVLLAVQRLQVVAGSGPLLLDAPGLFRGMAASELLPALVCCAGIDRVLVLSRRAREEPVLADLAAATARVTVCAAMPGGSSVSSAQRRRRRSTAWQQWLEGAARVELDLGEVAVTGAPPPREDPCEWAGRQVSVVDAGGATLALGEVETLDDERLVLTAAPFDAGRSRAVVVRDARRDPAGQLCTARRHRPQLNVPLRPWQGPIVLPGPAGGAASMLRGELVGGLFGDPMMHLGLVGEPRCLLFDLGEHPELPVRLAHHVSAVFLSHAHMDHISGFVWLLRRRVGWPGTCRIFGPAGTAERIAAFVAGFTWDRIGDDGPRFEVAELASGLLRRLQIRAGDAAPRLLGVEHVHDAVIHRDTGFVVRAAVLDHGTPVLAFAIEEERRLGVRPDRLQATGLPPGPWLGTLKRLVAEERLQEVVELPGGGSRAAGSLAAELLVTREGQRLAYATDVADTSANRAALVELAGGAHLLVCEAAFTDADAERARLTGHLTARACGEIATAAGVRRLLPCHLSSRYQLRPQVVLAEVAAACDHMWLPSGLLDRLEAETRGL